MTPTDKSPREPYYEGDGNLSLNDLEKLCRDYKEFCYQSQLQKQNLKSRLKKCEGLLKESMSDKFDKQLIKHIENVQKYFAEVEK